MFSTVLYEIMSIKLASVVSADFKQFLTSLAFQQDMKISEGWKRVTLMMQDMDPDISRKIIHDNHEISTSTQRGYLNRAAKIHMQELKGFRGTSSRAGWIRSSTLLRLDADFAYR